MTDVDRWTALFTRNDDRIAWENHVRRADQTIHSFLEFEPGLTLERQSSLSDGGPRGVPNGLLRGTAADGTLREAADGTLRSKGEDAMLRSVPFAVKDNIAVRPFRLTCGSRLLSKFVTPYTATAVARLQAVGAVPVGKTNLDEFGMGSSTQTSAFTQTSNPWDLSRVPGGSSGGSAAAVAAGLVPFALGSDTGGSVRQPAAFCGVYGLKPTYGAVSRYGLVAYASSLECIGVIAREVSWIRKVFTVIRGIDPRDHSSVEYRPPKTKRGPLTVGILRLGGGRGGGKARAGADAESAAVRLYPEVEAGWAKTLKTLPGLGFRLTDIEIPTLDYVVSAYYVIACAEASANLARFDGVRYGERAPEADNPEELVRLSRSRGLGEEVKLRILLGTYVLRSGFQDQYYLRAQRIRTALRRDLERAFATVDLIVMPVYPCAAFKRGDEGLDPFTQKLSDVFTSLANMAGLPAMSFPVSVENGLPVGMQFLAPPFAEELLLDACARYEEHFPAPKSPLYSMDWSS
jgi:aspartyl-tRNA(Asn)/glutamyl-tRNA(Gln) amidotransferase subunit A